MKQFGLKPNEITMSSMINAHAQAKDVHGAMQLYEEMKQLGLKPNESIIGSMINAHAQAKDVQGAMQLYEEMKQFGLKPNEITTSSMINAHAQAGDMQGAMQLYEDMKQLGLKPNLIIMNSLLKSIVISRTVGLSQVSEFFAEFAQHGLKPDSHTYFQLLLACKKTGGAKQAYIWFDELLQNGVEPIELLCNMLTNAVGEQRSVSSHLACVCNSGYVLADSESTRPVGSKPSRRPPSGEKIA